MVTRKPLTAAEREYLQTRRQAGATLAQVASELGCSPETVRKWWRRHRRGQTAPRRGRPCRGVLSTYPTALVERAVELKQSHPHWGPANVKLELKRDERFHRLPLPSDARLAALFTARCPAAVQPHRRHHYPDRPPAPARFAHQRWQLDGKEKVPLGEHDVVTILNVRDPASGLMLASRAVLTTTPKAWRKVTLTEAQDTLRQAFSEWGLPLEVQTDHEVVYTGAPAADFPTLFTLWLVGLGLTHVTSRDRRPTDQPHIERNHRTLGDMSWKDEPSQALAHLQALLDDRRGRYNTELPVRAADCGGRPPLVAYPQARHSGRPYVRELEWLRFDLARVDTYLAQFIWTRQINASGDVSLGSQTYHVGRQHHNQPVSIRFLPDTRLFRFTLADGTVISQLPALGLEAVDLIGFMPLDAALPSPFQLPLPLQRV